MESGNSISLHDCSRIREHFVGSVEGICDLPDPILCHILSFLPTKDAVATHILSQRWKFLWTLTNNLEFCSFCEEACEFVTRVNYVLLLHKPGYLNRLSVTWVNRCIPFHVNTWISAAITRNVRELFLRSELSKVSIHVQRSMFSCESLQSLMLDRNICISNVFAVSLPKLETLKLISVAFESEETLCKLLGGCPLLKYLCLHIDILKTIEYCHLDDETAFRCVISSTSLTRLELSVYDGKRDYENVPKCCVQLDAPSLDYMKLDRISTISIRQSLIFLVEANVQLVHLEPDYEYHNYYKSVVEAFHACDRAKTLVLAPRVIRAFSHAIVEMEPTFNKLTRLELTKGWTSWGSLHHFLTLSDNLEVFIIDKKYDMRNDVEYGREPDLVPRCLSNNLRKVSIGGYDGKEDDFAMVSYILKHGSVLQLMEIHLSVFNLEKKCELIQKICKLNRKSPDCEVECCYT